MVVNPGGKLDFCSAEAPCSIIDQRGGILDQRQTTRDDSAHDSLILHTRLNLHSTGLAIPHCTNLNTGSKVGIGTA